jgi:PAS domain S-box-containing protein
MRSVQTCRLPPKPDETVGQSSGRVMSDVVVLGRADVTGTVIVQHEHPIAASASGGNGGAVEFLLRMFSSEEFVPRAICFNMRPEIIWLHVVSDVLIALAYFSIPLALLYFVRRRKDLAFHWMFIMFGVFIFACGTTHVFGALAVWKPMYRLDGVVKAATAVVSVATAGVLWPLIPKALQLPSPSQLRAANLALEDEVTRRRSAEQRLRESNAELERRVHERTAELVDSQRRLRAVFDQAAVGITRLSTDGRMQMVNDRLCRMLGCAPASLCSALLESFCHPDDRGALEAQRAAALGGSGESSTVEVRLVRSDARVIWVEVTLSVVPSPTGQPADAIAVVQDVSQRRALQTELERHRERLEQTVAARTSELELSHQRLRVSERMASIGTLSAGLGHDMGNLLFPLRVRLESMRAKGLPGEFEQDLAAVDSACDYLAKLSRGLKQLAVDPDLAPARPEAGVSVATVWGEVAGLAASTLPRTATLTQRFEPGTPEVRIGAPALTQILMNLVQNAGDAVRTVPSGVVTVWAEPDPQHDSMVRLGVSDNGVGMTPEVLGRCLEPFYSTKTRSMSTGLGLALVQGLIQRAGGSLEIASRPGEGSTFTIRLPAVGRPGVATTKATARTAALRIADPRLARFVASILSASDINSGGEPDPAARIVVVDTSPEGLDLLTRALAQDGPPGRRFVVLGRVPAALASAAAAAGVVEITVGFKPVALAQALRGAIEGASDGARSGRPGPGPVAQGETA